METAAVLTGDLIDSTKAGTARVEQTMSTLAAAARQITPQSRFTRYRGDGWQILLPDPRAFLWAAVYLTAQLKSDPASLGTRIAVGIGTADNLGLTSLAGAGGTAFVHSGRALDAMAAKGRTLTLTGAGTDDIQRSTVAFVEDRMQRWSREQAQVVAHKLRPNPLDPDGLPTQDDMARSLGITRQAVAARLQAAGWALILNACTAFGDHIWNAADV